MPSLSLSDNEAQVWCASLNQSPQGAAAFAVLLSADEQARAGRFYFERDRNRYIIGRGLLRTLLGSYIGLEPAQIEFRYGPHGKPALATSPPGKMLQFNLAHSNELAVYVFRRNHPIGIDVEHVRPFSDEDKFAEQMFAPGESALIRSLQGEQKRKAFFKIWTCKEAVLKTSGDGLTKSLDQTEISFDGESARLASIDGDKEKAARWRLEMFQPAPDYQAALAFEGENCQIMFHWADAYFR